MARRDGRLQYDVAFLYSQPFIENVSHSHGSQAAASHMERLDVARERNAIEQAAQDVSHPLAILARPATTGHFLEACESSMRILHFCGHGQKTGLIFESELGTSTTLNLETIQRHFSQLIQQNGDPPSLAFLGACQSIESGLILCKAGVPFVVVSTKDVPDKLFSKFTEQFYRHLLPQSNPVTAFESARFSSLEGDKCASDEYFKLLCAGRKGFADRPAGVGAGATSRAGCEDDDEDDGAGSGGPSDVLRSDSAIVYLGMLDDARMVRAVERLNFQAKSLSEVDPSCLVNDLGRKHPFLVPRMGLGKLSTARSETRLVSRTRHKELHACLKELRPAGDEARLVVLTGSPGVGKTSMALLLADHVRYRAMFPGGVFVVPVGDITGVEPPVDGAASGYEGERRARQRAQQREVQLQPPETWEVEPRPPRLFEAVEGAGEAGGDVSGRRVASANSAVGARVPATIGEDGPEGQSAAAGGGGPGVVPQLRIPAAAAGSGDTSCSSLEPYYDRWREALWRRVRDCVLAGVGHALADTGDRLGFVRRELDTTKQLQQRLDTPAAGPGAATRPVGEPVTAEETWQALDQRERLLQAELLQLQQDDERYARRFKAIARVRSAAEIGACLQRWGDTLLVVDGADCRTPPEGGVELPVAEEAASNPAEDDSPRSADGRGADPEEGLMAPAAAQRAVSEFAGPDAGQHRPRLGSAQGPAVGLPATSGASPAALASPGASPHVGNGVGGGATAGSSAGARSGPRGTPSLSKSRSVPVRRTSPLARANPLEELVAGVLGLGGVAHAISGRVGGHASRGDSRIGLGGGVVGAPGFDRGASGVPSSSSVVSSAGLGGGGVEMFGHRAVGSSADQPGHVSMLVTCCRDSPLARPDAVRVRQRKCIEVPTLKLLGSQTELNTGWLLMEAYYHDFDELRKAARLQDFGIVRIPPGVRKSRKTLLKFLKGQLFKQPAFQLAQGCPRALIRAMQDPSGLPMSIQDLEASVRRVLPSASAVTWEQRREEAFHMLKSVSQQVNRGLLRRWERKDLLAPAARVWRDAKQIYRQGLAGGAGVAGGAGRMGPASGKLDPDEELPWESVLSATQQYLLRAVGEQVLGQRWSVSKVRDMDVSDMVRFASGKWVLGREGQGQGGVRRAEWQRFVSEWLQHAAGVLRRLPGLLTVHTRYRYLIRPFMSSDSATHFLWQLAKQWDSLGLCIMRCGSVRGSLAISYYGQNETGKRLVRRAQYHVLEGGRLRHGGGRGGGPAVEHDSVASLLESERSLTHLLAHLVRGGVDSVSLEKKANVVGMLREHEQAAGGLGLARGGERDGRGAGGPGRQAAGGGGGF